MSFHDHALPLGRFQVHLPGPAAADALRSLEDALDERDTILDEAFAARSGISGDEFGKRLNASLDRLKIAADRLSQSMRPTESPEVLPRRTLRLVFASIVAKALHLDFEVIKYDLVEAKAGKHHWIVVGQTTDKHGRRNENIGTSFMLDREEESMSEGALLSACADSFVRCISAVVPDFPWDH